MPDLPKHHSHTPTLDQYLTPKITNSELSELSRVGAVEVERLMDGQVYHELAINTAILVITAVIKSIEAQQKYLKENRPVKGDKTRLAEGIHFNITIERGSKLTTLKKHLKDLHIQKSASTPKNLNPQIWQGGSRNNRRK